MANGVIQDGQTYNDGCCSLDLLGHERSVDQLISFSMQPFSPFIHSAYYASLCLSAFTTSTTSFIIQLSTLHVTALKLSRQSATLPHATFEQLHCRPVSTPLVYPLWFSIDKQASLVHTIVHNHELYNRSLEESLEQQQKPSIETAYLGRTTTTWIIRRCCLWIGYIVNHGYYSRLLIC